MSGAIVSGVTGICVLALILGMVCLLSGYCAEGSVVHCLQCVHEQRLAVGEQMRIDVHRCGDMFVADAFRDGGCGKPLINEQGDVCFTF